MKKLINLLINILFIISTIIFIVINNPLLDNLIDKNNILLLIFTFIFIHIFKCFRQYLLLIESGINFKKYFNVYIKTTLCSIVLPFKIGEIYKGYEYGYMVNNYLKGFLTVIVDKVLDAILLLFLLVPYEIRNLNNLSTVTIIILVFTIVFLILYFSFNTTYYYLNKHFIKKSNEMINLVALKILEQCNELYNYVKGLLRGRLLILIIFTIMAWLFEWIFMYILGKCVFNDYINAVFFGNQNYIFSNYVIISVICFCIFKILLLFRKWGVKNENSFNL